MIHSFTCKNFYSFGDEATVDFVVNENAPKNNWYFSTKSGTRLSKAEMVIGPNAAGKTNLMKIAPFLQLLIVDSFNSNPDAPLQFQPFVFGKNKEEPTELSVVFEIDGKVYTYSFVFTKDHIISEELTVMTFVKEKRSRKNIFRRSWDGKKERYIFSEKFGLPKGFKDMLRKNASVISTAARLNHKESLAITAFWQRVRFNVAETGWGGNQLELYPFSMQLLRTFNFFTKNDALKKEAEELIKCFDVGFSEFTIETKKLKDTINVRAVTVREVDGTKYSLGLEYESSGTKQLIVLLGIILRTLKNGGVAVIDEIDANLHPDILIELINLFLYPETNPHNAQILFTTHSHLILSRLDKYQITLVEKNEASVSEVWRLDEVSGVRPDENYYMKYITGAYDAVPRIT